MEVLQQIFEIVFIKLKSKGVVLDERLVHTYVISS